VSKTKAMYIFGNLIFGEIYLKFLEN